MTQALAISMLMLGADSTLKPDSTGASSASADNQLSQTNTELSAQGSGFGALLNGMVLPANSGKSGANQRQIPAAAGELSMLSAAMLQATAVDSDVDNAENTALANSLLLQIALKSQASADSESGIAAEANADAGTEPDAVAKQLLILADGSTTLTPQQQAVVVALADSKGGGSAEAQASTEHSGQKDITAETGAQTADSDSAETSQYKQPAKSIGGEAAITQQNPPQPKAVTTAQSEQGASSALEQTAAQLSAVQLAETELATSQQSQIAATTTQNSRQNTDTAADKNTATIAVDNKTVAEPNDSHGKTAAVAAEPLNAAFSSQAKQKTTSKTDDKALASTDNDKTTATKTVAANMMKKASAEQGSQQQQQGQAQSERQFAAMDQLASVTKTSADTASGRLDNSFNASLQAAEQRQQSTVSKAVVKTAPEQLKQSLNLQQHDAASQLRERVNLMVRQNIQIAEIRLDPVGLGQMQIKIDVQQEQTNVQFIVQQPQAKELLEQQLPRLRDMLQQQGIVLGEGSVQQQSQQERQLSERQQQHAGQGQQQRQTDEDGAAEAIQAQLKVAPTDRLVDYYA